MPFFSPRARSPISNLASPFWLLGLVWCAGLSSGLDPDKRLDQYVHRSWTTVDGLPQNSITDILQCRTGYMWVATFGGLARFDGARFTVFDVATAPGLRSNRLTALHEDSNGVLWIGTEEGFVSRMEGDRFSTLGPEDGLTGSSITDLTSDEHGLWASTVDGLWHLRDGEWSVYAEADGLGGEPTSAVAHDTQGELWVGTDKGVARRRGGSESPAGFEHRFSFEHQPISYRPSDDGIYGMVFDSQDEFWLGFRGALLRVEGDELAVWAELPPSVAEFSGALLRDRDANLWFTSAGVGRRRQGQVADDGQRVVGLGPGIRAFFEDRQGQLWIGTDRTGLHLLRDGALISYVDPLRLSTTVILERQDGDILVGTSCHGLLRFRAGAYSRVPLPDRSLACINGLVEDRSGTLWVGASRLGRLDADGWTVTDAEEIALVRALHEGRDGVIWIGMWNGLASFENGSLTHYSSADGVIQSDIRFFAEDAAGNLWIGSSQGMSRFLSGEISAATATHYTVEDGLPNNAVRAIYPDAAGSLWVGTYGGGLARFAEGRFTVLTSRVGLHENTVSRIFEDQEGYLWLSGNRGISRLRLSEANAFAGGEIPRVRAVLYDEEQGMAVSETNGGHQPAGWQGRDGRLWFPTIEGIVVADPTRLKSVRPPVNIIERIRVGHREVDPNGLIEVDPGDWDLEVEFTGLKYGLPHEMQFRYRLVGDSQGWVEVGNRRTAYYTKVAPGTYTFEVTSSAYAGSGWNDEAASFEIVFEPFLWQIAGVRVAVFALALALAAWAVGWGYSRSQRKKLEEERRVSARLREVDRLKDEFLANTSHELRTPLFGILGLAESLLDEGRVELSPALRRQHLETILASGRRLEAFVEDLLDFSRLDNGSLEVVRRAGSGLSEGGGAGETRAGDATGGRALVEDLAPRMLIVDDEPINRLVLEQQLLAEGFLVCEAADGPGALKFLGTEKVDLVLLDVMMPVMSGYEVCCQLRQRFSVAELPILFLTAKSRPEDIAAGFAAGGNDYLTKPIDQSELMARVRLHLKLASIHRRLAPLID